MKRIVKSVMMKIYIVTMSENKLQKKLKAHMKPGTFYRCALYNEVIGIFKFATVLYAMKTSIKYYVFLLLSSLVVSCNGQQKTKIQKTITTNETAVEQEDHDPYFSETTAISSPYGPKSITRNIIQDKKGNMWFATWEGIIQYDGKTFTNFTNKEKLRRFHVFSLLEDSKGNLWFGTIGAGVYRYDGKVFTNFTTEDGLAHNSIGCIVEDKNGLLWLGTMGGISTYDGATFRNLTIAGGANNNDVNTIVEDDTGKLWIGTRGEAFTYNGEAFTKITNSLGQAFYNVRTILKDQDSTIWLGGNDGFWSYDGSTFRNHSTNFTGSIYQDAQENIWTSSAADGNSRNWVWTKYDKRSRATPFEIKSEENMFFGMTEDKEGKLWLGTLRGAYRYDGNRFENFSQPTILIKEF
jgi:ligand-binding sensor domain-containing protein